MKQAKQFTHNHLSFSRPERIDTDSGRFYKTPEGKLYPSITTVLGSVEKDGIKRWKERVGEKQAEEIKNRAAARGTRLHTYVENYLKGEPNVSPDIFTVSAFMDIQSVIDEIDEVYGIEMGLYSDYLRCAGTTDIAAMWRGKRTILDIKTSTKPKEEAWITSYFQQTSAYCVMLEERTGVSFPQIGIIMAVETGPRQVFVKRRADYIWSTIDLIQDWHRVRPAS